MNLRTQQSLNIIKSTCILNEISIEKLLIKGETNGVTDYKKLEQYSIIDNLENYDYVGFTSTTSTISENSDDIKWFNNNPSMIQIKWEALKFELDKNK